MKTFIPLMAALLLVSQKPAQLTKNLQALMVHGRVEANPREKGCGDWNTYFP